MPDPTRPRKVMVAKRKPQTFEDSVYAITGKPAKQGYLRDRDILRGELGKYVLSNDSVAFPERWVVDAAADDNLNVIPEMRRALSDPRRVDMTFAHEMGHRIDPQAGLNVSRPDSAPDYVRPDIRDAFTRGSFGQQPDTNEYAASSRDEWFAEAFTNAVQFLREHAKGQLRPEDSSSADRAGLEELDIRIPGTKSVVQQLLKDPLYAQHRMNTEPIAQARAVRPDATRVVKARRK